MKAHLLTISRTLQCRVLALCLAGSAVAAAAEGDAAWRSWKSSAGTAIEARLISASATEVVLEKRDGRQVTVKLTQLSAEDRAFLSKNAAPAPQPKTGEKTIPGLDAVPGTVSGEIVCKASPQWTYRVYLPKEFHTGARWPVCYVMDPGGGSAKTLERYLPAAEHLGVILTVSIQAKNEFAQSGEALIAMSRDVAGRLPLLPGLVIASGMSGGSRMSYLLAETDKNIGGILACGAGNGVYPEENAAAFRQAELRRGIVVCGIFGTNDYNRREGVRTHRDYKKDSRLIWFPGNHDWAPANLITEGMAHVLGEMLSRQKDPALNGLRADFAGRQLALANSIRETAPWTAFHWAEYLTKFPGGAKHQSDAKALAAELGRNPEVIRALKAEREIDEFAAKYFSDGKTDADKTPDEQRAKVAERRAETFTGLPHAELLKRMGGPAN
jgi:hypothetical protein